MLFLARPFHVFARSFVAGIALFAVLTMGSGPASAQFGDFTRALKKAAPKVLPRVLVPPSQGSGSSRSGGGERRNSGDGSGSESDDSGASGSAATSKEVKKEIDRLEQARIARNAVASLDEKLEEIRADRIERARNVERAIQDFLSCLKGLHNLPSPDTKWLCDASETDKTAKGSEISQVTAGEIMRELEEAYRRAHLTDFERLAGELWTRERLMVRIVDRSRLELPPYFKGVGAKGPSMEELRKVFQRSSEEVYSRALEISEITGVSNSFDRFIRTIYEHSDEVAPNLGIQGSMLGVDGRFERVATAALSAIPREKLIKERDTEGDRADDADAADPLGLERQFRFRFRARRVYYDCLSAVYPELGKTAGVTGSAIEASVSISGQGKPDGAANAAAEPAAASDGDAQSPAAREELAQADSVEGNAQDVAWTNAQTMAHGKCRSSIEKVAKLAMERKIRPESARWTGGFNLSRDSGIKDTDGGEHGGRLLPLSREQER